MSPTQAFHNHIFHIYLVLVAGVLAFAGATIAFYQWGLHKPMRSVWLTYRGWLVMIPIVTATMVLGRWAVIVGAALLSMLGFKEFARATGLYRDWWMCGAVYLAIVALAVAAAMNDPFKGYPGWFGLYMAMPVFAINLLVIIPVIRNQAEGPTAGNRPGYPRLHLHRLDVRPSRLPG